MSGIESEEDRRGASFPIVGIGASAGGLEALRQLFSALPGNTGMGFVIIQHLSPNYHSNLAEILSRATAMPVCEATDEPAVEPDHVYVVPPARDMIISERRLRLFPQERSARHQGIDQFFRSLAADCGHLAIGVVLSGGASDGTLGLEVIKAEGGVTFAQDESAQQDSMPRSAITSGCVDFVLPPDGIAHEIARIGQHAYVTMAKESAEEDRSGHKRIAEMLHLATGADFSHYKQATMRRRILRRMMVHKIGTLEDYEEYLRATPKEVEALYQDFLISVTNFFRNPESWDALAEKIFPKLIANRSRQEPVRIWTLGCSTGEEAYSLAMLFFECVDATRSLAELQLFATDLNASAIERARAGRYPRSIAQEVSPDRLRHFFMEEDGGYRINKSIRERCVFSRHNVLSDPPFSHVDFISCRNVLIYMEPVLQQQVLPLLHYSLKPGGHLWLGSSESLGASRALFDVEDARHRIFVRRPGPSPSAARFRPNPVGLSFAAVSPGPRQMLQSQLHRDAERLLIEKYAPPGVVITAEFEIVQFRGDTSCYLSAPAGPPSLQLLKMLREGLLPPVRAALDRAAREKSAVREEGARVRSENGFRDVAIEVIPIKSVATQEAGYIVLFDDGTSALRPAQPVSAPITGEDEAFRLSRELAETRAYLQSIIEQQDATNEELQSANEEAQSANEEMQSVNEELETTKEEIQSSNEELTTVNDELNNRNLELNALTNDLTNLLASIQLSIVIVSRDLRIRRFTPMAEKVFNLVESDVGRSLRSIQLDLAIPNLEPLLREVIDTASAREQDVQDGQGRWFSLRVRPYLTHENKIDGAVLTLVDVDALRRRRDFAESIITGLPVPLLVLDAQLLVRRASRLFYEHFQVAPADTEGRFIYELGNRQWDIPALQRLLEEVLPREKVIKDFEVRHDFEQLGHRIMLVSARRLQQGGDGEPLIILSIEDITMREQAGVARARLAAIVESSNDAIISEDLQGLVTSWNAAAERIYGYSAQEIIGQPVAVFIPSDRRSEEVEILEHIRRGEGIQHFETVRRRKDGTLIDVSLTVSPVVDGEGKVVGASKIARDITERCALQKALVARAAELAQTDRRKDEFLAMLAHELRNPLAPLCNAAEVLGLKDASLEERDQAQEILRRQVENMTRIIDDLLDVARITEGKIELRRAPIELAALLESVAKVARSSLAKPNQTIELSLPADPVFLNADATRLEQVLTNLLGNACKYSGGGSHIWLSAQRAPGAKPPEVIISVRDDGIGIAPELLPHVFGLFVQGSRALDRTHGGLGIGLALVERLVKLHGGTVEARSEGVGRGAEFIIRLPVEERAPAPGSFAPRVGLEPPCRILVVDDHLLSAQSLAMLLRHRGHEVRIASGGPEALMIADEFAPQFVILDIGLPVMDGFEVARRLRSMPATSNAFLVALSGYTSQADIANAKKSGFNEYLVKPANVRRLTEWLWARNSISG